MTASIQSLQEAHRFYWAAPENPWHRFGSYKDFASSDGSARLTCFLDGRLSRGPERIGLIGRMSISARDAGQSLLREAEQWLRGQGCREVIGPVDWTMWHHHRFQTGGETPTHLEPNNPSWYPSLLRASGFRPLHTYESYRRSDISPLLPLIEPALQEALRAGFVIEQLPLPSVRAELRALYAISCKSFLGEKGLVDLTWDEFRYLYEPLLGHGNGCVYVARHDAQTIGYLYAVRDPHREQTLLMKTVAVLPSYQRRHLAVALAAKAHRDALTTGVTSVEYLLVRTGNNVATMPYPGVRPIRSFATYAKVV